MNYILKIKLTQEPYIRHDRLRIGVYALNNWYETAARDEDGNAYRVIWSLRDDYDGEDGNEENACEWDAPFAVLDYDGRMIDDGAFALES